ncbi:MAG: TSUP family transporter [Acidobacteriota bacterium]
MDIPTELAPSHLAVLPLVSFAISFFTSMGGLSGAFLLLPFQMSVLGFTSPSVSATNQLYNVVAIPGGVYRYVREGRMVWPLVWVVVLATIPGVLIGAWVRVRWLPDPRNFKVFAGLVLLYIGARLARDLIARGRRGESGQGAETRFQELVASSRGRTGGPGTGDAEAIPRVRVDSATLRRIRYEFYGERFEFPTVPVFLLSGLVGVVGGVYGIGGGAILAPFFVAFLGLPIYTVAGATLMGTLVTSVAGVAFYQGLAPLYPDLAVAPDWRLGLLFGLGGLAGTYCGARCQKHVPAKVIKWMVCLVVVATGATYVFGSLR